MSTPQIHDDQVHQQLQEWIEYADKLERVIEMMCGMTRDKLIQAHGEQGLRLVRPERPQ